MAPTLLAALELRRRRAEVTMRRIRYECAMSLDGFIAGPNGEYDWIEFDAKAAEPFFKELYAQFDIAVMGRKSYEQFPGAVEGLDTYVLSRTLAPGKRGDVTVLGEDGLERIAELRAQDGKDIWLWGGGTLFGSFASAGLVDTVEVAVMPVLLGGGIPLTSLRERVDLELVDFGVKLPGIVNLSYRVRGVHGRIG